MKPFDEELVSGSIFRSLWKLAWPGVTLNLVNGIHGIVDHVLVGHFVEAEASAANAAIGVAWSVFLLIVVFLSSLFHGTSVLVARYAGRQDRETMNNVAYHSFLAMLYATVLIVAPVGYFLSPYLLGIVRAEAEVEAFALSYLRVLFAFSGPLFLIILLTHAFQASGDPRFPLKLAALTTVLNVAMSAVLIPGLGPVPALGVVGAAVGTCLAPVPSIVLALSVIVRRKTILGPPERYALAPDPAIISRVARIGTPTGMQAVLLNLGGVLLLRIIGGLEHSTPAQAAYVICYSQIFQLAAWTALGMRNASSTLMGQNIGAGRTDRGRRGVMAAAGLGASLAGALGIAYWTAPVALLAAFNAAGDPMVRELGATLLRYLAPSAVCLAVAQAYTGGLIGAGDTKRPMLIAFLSQIVLLLGFCYGLAALDLLTINLVWTALLGSHCARMLLSIYVFNRGAWRRIRVELDA